MDSESGIFFFSVTFRKKWVSRAAGYETFHLDGLKKFVGPYVNRSGTKPRELERKMTSDKGKVVRQQQVGRQAGVRLAGAWSHALIVKYSYVE